MPWGTRLDPLSRIIHVDFIGNVSAEDVRECASTVIGLMKQGDTGLVLADLTAATDLALSTTDIVELPALFRALGLDRPFREAMVAPLESAIRGQAEFYETVCVNRGIAVRVFRDLDAAQQWLGAP
jgi:hypothetical protein